MAARLLKSLGSRRALLALAAVALIAHGRTIGYGFIFGTDDWLNFDANSRLSPPSLSHFAEIWTSLQYRLYIPVTETIWWALRRVTSNAGSPLSFEAAVHGLEVLVHFANAVLVYALAARLLRRGRAGAPAVLDERVELAALAGALLFLVHPVQSQTVSYATCTKEVFALFPSLLGTLAALAYFESGAPAALALSTLFLTLAMLALPVAVVLPVFLALLAAVCLKPPRRRLLAACALWAVPLAVLSWIGLSGLHEELIVVDVRQPIAVFPESSLYPIPYLSPWLKPFRALSSLAFYAWKTLVPFPLIFDYESFFYQRLGDPLEWAKVLLAAVALVWLVRAVWRNREETTLVAGVGWALLTVAPMLGFVPVVQQGLSDVADRYLYFWLVGVGLVVAWAVVRASVEWTRVGVLAATMVCAVATVAHQSVWSSPEALFVQYARHVPDGWRAHWLLGTILRKYDRRSVEAGTELREAFTNLKNYHKARGVYPLMPVEGILEPYGMILVELGRLDELIEAYRDAIDLDARYRPIARFSLGNLLVLKGDIAGGLSELTAAGRLDPSVFNRGFILAEGLLSLYPERFSARSLAAVARVNPQFSSLEQMAESAARYGARH